MCRDRRRGCPVVPTPASRPLDPLYSLLADAIIALHAYGPGPQVARILQRVADVADMLSHDPRLAGPGARRPFP